MAVKDDFGTHAYRQLSLQFDEQPAQRRVPHALPSTMKEVVAVDQDEFDAIERARDAHSRVP